MTETPLLEDATLYDVVRTIERSRRRIAVVTGLDGQLLGTLTDGDVRRCLLNGGSLATLARDAMTKDPVRVTVGTPDSYIADRMRRANIEAVPVVDTSGRYVGLIHVNDLGEEHAEARGRSGFSAAVIMAGGEGTRLRPLTATIPKPMVKIDGTPLLEHLVRRLAAAGVEQVYISVNYLSHMIEDHLGDGSHLGTCIQYLRETRKMGTAGALSLLPERPDGPIVVMNGDILTTSGFGNLYTFHTGHAAAVTVAAVDYRVEIPYGVLRVDGAYVRALEEKPSQQFLCNAGIYAITPEALDCVPDDFYNMTDLIEDCLKTDRKVAVFPVHEYWSDIGTPADLEKARAAFARMNNA